MTSVVLLKDKKSLQWTLSTMYTRTRSSINMQPRIKKKNYTWAYYLGLYLFTLKEAQKSAIPSMYEMYSLRLLS